MKDVQPILGNDVVPVKNAPAYPAADDDSHGTVKNEVIDIQTRPCRLGLPGAIPREPPRGDEADEVHDSVPVDAQGTKTDYRSDGDGNGVYVRVGQHARYFRLSLTRQ